MPCASVLARIPPDDEARIQVQAVCLGGDDRQHQENREVSQKKKRKENRVIKLVTTESKCLVPAGNTGIQGEICASIFTPVS